MPATQMWTAGSVRMVLFLSFPLQDKLPEDLLETL